MAALRPLSRPPLLERLAADGGEPRDYGRAALAESVRVELSRLLNTRRSAQSRLQPATVIDYGIADWSSLYAERSDDRLKLKREIRTAIASFEPRLELQDLDVQPLDGRRHSLRVRLVGFLREGSQRWPVAFVVDMAEELKVAHERVD